MPYSILLPDSLVDLLAKKLHICTSPDRFREVMAPWNRLDEWGESLFALVDEMWVVFKALIEQSLLVSCDFIDTQVPVVVK